MRNIINWYTKSKTLLFNDVIEMQKASKWVIQSVRFSNSNVFRDLYDKKRTIL